MTRSILLSAGACALALTLCGCGGGGGGGGGGGFVSSPPPPTSAPGSAAVTIFAQPKPETYAIVGASVAGAGGNLDTYPSADTRFLEVSGGWPDQPQIRYSADRHYEIMMPGSAWDGLIPYKGLADPPADNNYFQPAAVRENYGYLLTWNARLNGYDSSEIAAWGSSAAGRWGYVAFGDPTPPGAVPLTGSATFAGLVEGSTDIMTADALYGGYTTGGVGGTVTLNFDFGQGTLSGAMDLEQLGTFDFTKTVFSVGSATYSGQFDTSAHGDNFFVGQFTGPKATETIGAWALPFIYSGDQQTHEAFGAWIAKQQR